ncbi:hypothetical protein [Mesorhizobium sp. KR2-14]|uniref:hypothetical protein n=1 Tax=Mesorhizobium sp. KR2-14 TaxID=3156610 RepID=UPI0032B38082
MHSFGGLLEPISAANQPPILSKRLDFALPDAIPFAPHLAFTHFTLEEFVSQVLSRQSDAIDDVWGGGPAEIIDKTFLETQRCGDLFQYFPWHTHI